MKYTKWLFMGVLAFGIMVGLPEDLVKTTSSVSAETTITMPSTPTINKMTDRMTMISGKAEPGVQILVYANNKKLAKGIAEKGVYSLKIAKQKPGTTITVYAVDADLNKSNAGTIKVAAEAVIYQTTEKLNMRTGAAVKYKITIVIPAGKKVEFISKNGSWFKVKYGTKIGWVHSAYLKKPGVSAYPAPSTKTPGTYVGGILIVNKKYGLPSTYNPGMDGTAQRSAKAMIADAKKQGILLKSISSYRSFSYQSQLYANYVKKHGKKEADRFSARPGFSEHQTGLSFDFGGQNNSANWLKGTFGDTKEGKWLAANAHKYGFILRYPKGKESITGYMYEPWHFRYIGGVAAAKVKASGLTLEEYLGL